MRFPKKPLSLHDEQAPAIDRPFFACLMRALCNQTPSATAIETAFKEGEEATRRKYEDKLKYTDSGRIAKLEKDLEAFKDLKEKLGIWGGSYGIEKGIEKYNALSGIDLTWLDRHLSLLDETIKEVKKAIPESQRAKF